MDINKARTILGEKNKNLADAEVIEFIHTGEMLTDAILDIWSKMTPEERRKWKVKKPKRKGQKVDKNIL